ncbi:MAG: 16S rRNA (cytosine(1402)-N(4))-methyltransferase RsmH [Candidatus Promineifilaceae bacterium]
MGHTSGHIPVLYDEVLSLLAPKPGGSYLDCTVGAGGHTAGILEQSAPSGRVLALDRDPEAAEFARRRLAHFGERVIVVNVNYADMADAASSHGFNKFDGILMDLGLSSRQLADRARGFSFMNEGPLDMRFNPTQGQTAADLVNTLPEEALADIFWRFGEEKQSRRLAKLIVKNRPFFTTTALAAFIAKHSRQRGRIHPATKIFQALRIATNDELAAVEKGLETAVTLLKPGGRLAVISFHSLEDRLVKQFMRRLSKAPDPNIVGWTAHDAWQPTLKLITRKAVQASDAEIENNPRSRSARLRVAEKIK